MVVRELLQLAMVAVSSLDARVQARRDFRALVVVADLQSRTVAIDENVDGSVETFV